MNNEEKILSLLEKMASDVSGLKAGQAKLEADVQYIRDVQNGMKGDMVTLYSVENLVKMTSEQVSSLVEAKPRLDRLEERTENHGNRIWALEQAVKR